MGSDERGAGHRGKGGGWLFAATVATRVAIASAALKLASANARRWRVVVRNMDSSSSMPEPAGIARRRYSFFVRRSTITKRHVWRPHSYPAAALGAELRRLRLERGLSQRELGGPLSGAFVSAVERGTTVPSLPALAIMAGRLRVPLSAIFAAINNGLDSVYNGLHEDQDAHGGETGEDASRQRRR